MKSKSVEYVLLASFVFFCMTRTLFAAPPPNRDTLEAQILNQAPAAVAMTSGNPAITLATSTWTARRPIVLQYTLIANAWPTGVTVFGTFDLGLRITYQTGGSGGPTTGYSTQIDLTDSTPAGQRLTMTPTTASFTNVAAPVSGTPSSVGSTTITIGIDCSSGCDDTDGKVYKGVLTLSSPANKLDGFDSGHRDVVVEITLVHPTQSCLQLYHFITDQSFGYFLSNPAPDFATFVNVNTTKTKIVSTTPFGQMSDNVLVVNTCAGSGPLSFTMNALLDQTNLFRTNPTNNPGNATFLWVAGQTVNPSTFNINQFSTVTKQGQSLCIRNLSLSGSQSALMTVHMNIQQVSPSGLPGNTTGTLQFVATLLPAPDVAGCAALATDIAYAGLGYTVR